MNTFRIGVTVVALQVLLVNWLHSEGNSLDVELAGKKVEAPEVMEPDVDLGRPKNPEFNELLVLFEHPEVLKVEREVERWKREKKISLAPWFPNFSASFQWEDSTKYDHPTLGEQDQSRSVSRLSVDQLLFDFGEGYFQYQTAVEEWKGIQAKLYETCDRIIYEGLSAGLKSLLQKKLLDQAIASEKNFLEQKGLEQQKVKGGQGFSTDVLQVEVQHLGALAKVQQASLDHASALEGVVRWWGKDGMSFSEEFLVRIESLMEETPLPEPSELADWVDGAPALLQNRHERLAMSSRKYSMMGGRWGPKVSLRLVSQRGEELGGVGSYDREDRVSLQAELPLNLGGTFIDEVASVGLQLESLVEEGRGLARETLKDLKVGILTLKTKSELVKTRRDQMRIAQKYLEGAEKERLMGRRSLIDVLNGELLRLQAESEMEIARVERVLAWSRVLQLCGRLGQTFSLQ